MSLSTEQAASSVVVPVFRSPFSVFRVRQCQSEFSSGVHWPSLLTLADGGGLQQDHCKVEAVEVLLDGERRTENGKRSWLLLVSCPILACRGRVAELADAQDSGSCEVTLVRVQVPPRPRWLIRRTSQSVDQSRAAGC